jgi:4-methylaminobutanoate oxidase (formaldehyde-forming)
MEGRLPDRAAVVIVGAGVVGTSLAYHLAKLSRRDMLVLERNEIGAGTTWHAAGAVGRMRVTAGLARINDRSAAMYARMAQESGLPTGWVENGSLTLARTEDRMVQLRRTGALATHFGVDVQEISPGEAAALWPLADMRDVVGAVWLPNDGIVDPLALTRAIAEAARRDGVRIFEGAGVEEVLTTGGRIAGVRTSLGDVEAETVVLCTGMWTPQLAQAAGVAIPIQPVEHHYVLSNAIGEDVDTLPVVRDPDGCIYFRGRDGKLMLGAFQATSKPWMVDRVPDDFAFSLLEPDWQHFAPPFAEGRKRLPQLDALGIDSFVNGPEGFTPDGNALVGAVPGIAGLYISAGFNSSGIAYGGGVGEALAQWIAEGEQPFDLWAVDVRRFGPAQAKRDFLRARGVEVLGTHMRLAYPGIEWSEGRDLNRSALHERLAGAGASFGEKLGVERANWFSRNGTELRHSFGRPSWFADSAAEHEATRNAAGLFDVSSFAKLRVTGPGALALLQRACAGDVDVEPGRVVYTAMLTARGTFASDLTVLRTGAQEFTVITGTAHRVADPAWLNDLRDGEDVLVADVTDETSVLALMGPAARDLLSPLTDAPLSLDAFPFSTSQQIDVAGVRLRAVRITYVGELGWELHVPREDAGRLYDAVREAGRSHGLADAGYYAINSLRLEKGYRQWGADITRNDTPLEAGLGFAVAWDTEFHGRDALLAQRDAGPPRRRLVSLVLDDPEPILWGGERFFRDGVCVGYTTSAAYGHTLGASVALGYLDLGGEPVTRALIESGAYAVDVSGERVGARVSLDPLFDPERERILA